MRKTRETFIFGLALFAGFFGAGNLILPPFLGFNAGPDWWLVSAGFLMSTTVFPLLAIVAHAKLQGTMFDFGKKVSPLFSTVFCFCVYIITIGLPCPRTAAVAHEIAIAPFFGTSSLLTSSVYFVLVFVFVMNRSQVLNVMGKYLTPIIVFILLLIITIGLVTPTGKMVPSKFGSPLSNGLLEGYQTYDAMAGLVMGGVVLVSLNRLGYISYTEKRNRVIKSGLIAVLGLFVIYVGLISVGAFFNSQFNVGISRTDLLAGIAASTLGDIGATFLSILVALACFTTAVAIVISVADFFKVYFHQYSRAYLTATIICCLTGILIGQMKVGYIIDVALPALMFIYPLCIVLILLNLLPEKFASKLVFRWVVFTTFTFSVPDFLGFIVLSEQLEILNSLVPLAEENLGWLLPATIAFVVVNFYERAIRISPS